MKAIVCVSSDGQLVRADETPRDDKQRYAALTSGGVCFVGAKTWRELPDAMRAGGGARRYEVLSNAENFFRPGIAATFKGYELLSILGAELQNSDAWVIGGNSIYSLCMPFTTMLYTSILRTAGGVGAFPFPNLQEWDILCDQTHVSHTFMIWKRRKVV